MALLGPNGGGKSTTVKVASACCRPLAGDVRYAGRSVLGISAEEAAALGVCTIPEGRGVFANLTVRENLWLATGTGVAPRAVEEAAFARFPLLGDRRNQLAGSMSGGEQQMLALSRALATDPAVLLLDELSMGLAPMIVGQIYETVAQLVEEGISVLVAEQFARTVLPIADVAAVMLNGRITAVGSPADIAADLETAYLGGMTTMTSTPETGATDRSAAFAAAVSERKLSAARRLSRQGRPHAGHRLHDRRESSARSWPTTPLAKPQTTVATSGTQILAHGVPRVHGRRHRPLRRRRRSPGCCGCGCSASSWRARTGWTS